MTALRYIAPQAATGPDGAIPLDAPGDGTVELAYCRKASQNIRLNWRPKQAQECISGLRPGDLDQRMPERFPRAYEVLNAGKFRRPQVT